MNNKRRNTSVVTMLKKLKSPSTLTMTMNLPKISCNRLPETTRTK